MTLSKNEDWRGSVQVMIGAGSAIAMHVARRLAALGARLALVGRDAEKLQPLAEELNGKAFQADATSFDEVENSVRDIREWAGRIDGVLNCVGSILLKPAHLTTAAELQQTLALNLVSAFATVRSAAAAMRDDGGSIVLMSSAAARVGLVNHEAIAAAKAGVIGLTRSAAATYAAHGVRVNAVAPGLVDTPMSARLTTSEAARNASLALHPLGMIGDPADVAVPICWLLGPDSRWVTGEVIGVDGGLARVKARPRREPTAGR